MLGHLEKGSIGVKVGELIKQGQIIARVGNSGSAETPHLHYEVRNGPDQHSEGLPSYFQHFIRKLGAVRIVTRKGQVDTGDIIENAQ